MSLSSGIERNIYIVVLILDIKMVQNSVDTKVTDLTNYVNAVKVAEADLLTRIHTLVDGATPTTPGVLPDYSRIEAPGAVTLRTDIMSAIDDAYSPANPLHPMHSVVDATAMGQNFYNEALLRNVLFPHGDQLKTEVGKPDLVDKIQAMAGKSQEQLHQRLAGPAGADIVANNNLADLQTYLKAHYAGIDTEIDAVTDKTQFNSAYAMDILRQRSFQITPESIKKAILGRD